MKKITNVSADRRPVMITLDHNTFRRSVYGYRRQTVHVGTTTQDGRPATVEQSRSIDGVLTLAWKESKVIHDDIELCPSVQALVRDKRVSVVPVEDTKPAASDTATTQTRTQTRKHRTTESQG